MFCRTEERIWSINNEKVYLHQRSRKYTQTPTYSEHQRKQTEADRSNADRSITTFQMKELLGTKMKKGKFRQRKIPTYSRASAYESEADRSNADRSITISDEEIIG